MTEPPASRNGLGAPRGNLAALVAARRRELGLSYGRMEILRGPSVGTTSKIERGLIDPTEDTLFKLDRALSWRPGTCLAIQLGTAGDDPAAWVAPPEPPPQIRHVTPVKHTEPCDWKRRYEALRAQTTSIRKRSMEEDYRYWDYAATVAAAIVEQAGPTTSTSGRAGAAPKAP